MHGLVLLALALAPIPAMAQEPISLESIVAPFIGPQTYCETGRWGAPQAHGISGTAFSRCVHRDGRFKAVQFADQPRKEVIWSDAKKLYRHSEYANYYIEAPLDDTFLLMYEGTRDELYPIYLSRLFNRYRPNTTDRTSASYFQSYKASSALSTPQHSVFERFDDENHRNSERLWVRNADKSIVRYEGLRDGVVLQFVEITSQEANRALTEADLWHEVPFYVRYSLENNPAMFIAGLFAADGFVSALFWKWSFSRATSVEDIVRRRRTLWRVQFWLFGGIAIMLAVLAVLTLVIPGKGHPPAIVFVFALAMWCAGAFALTAFFTLMSYPVQFLLSRQSGTDPVQAGDVS